MPNTFNTRDHVFANAQTGNLVLMTQNLMEGNLSHSLNYLLPIFAFIVGVFVAEQLQGRLKEKEISSLETIYRTHRDYHVITCWFYPW